MLRRLKPFFSCKEATRLASDALDRPLSRYEKVAMRFHMAICLMCRRWQNQVNEMDALLRQYPKGIDDTRQYIPVNRLSDACKIRIKKRLHEIDPPSDEE